ncbi:MAG: hypothetical protein KA028_01475 [Candidatus Pacebacteria bacterium]|nr:hypothetical protein [Candidatus Paceibacterota bacterium]MBP9851988.1 hypothetical protein [Candidatus Paceibacterota bacterium]
MRQPKTAKTPKGKKPAFIFISVGSKLAPNEGSMYLDEVIKRFDADKKFKPVKNKKLLHSLYLNNTLIPRTIKKAASYIFVLNIRTKENRKKEKVTIVDAIYLNGNGWDKTFLHATDTFSNGDYVACELRK